MTTVADFRKSVFSGEKLDKCAKFVGRSAYWKLYAIENILRVVLHSILSAQIGPNWWDTAVDKPIRSSAEKRRHDYAKRPWYTSPGAHDIYYTFLTQLNEIMRANINLFIPIIPDIDQWIARVEQLRLPRNVVGHMNYPGANDRRRIDVFYADCKKLLVHITKSGVSLAIPPGQ